MIGNLNVVDLNPGNWVTYLHFALEWDTWPLKALSL